MTPAARIAAVIEIISEAPAEMPAGAALRRGLQGRRYAGSGDRQAISALFWLVQRRLRGSPGIWNASTARHRRGHLFWPRFVLSTGSPVRMSAPCSGPVTSMVRRH